MEGSMLSLGFPFHIFKKIIIFLKRLKSITHLLKYPVVNNVLNISNIFYLSKLSEP